jgi:hypothetical protein
MSTTGMQRDEGLAFVAGDLNRVTLTADRAGRHAGMVAQVNASVRGTADALLTLDATPLSFEAFKAECAERGRLP